MLPQRMRDLNEQEKYQKSETMNCRLRSGDPFHLYVERLVWIEMGGLVEGLELTCKGQSFVAVTCKGFSKSTVAPTKQASQHPNHEPQLDFCDLWTITQDIKLIESKL